MLKVGRPTTPIVLLDGEREQLRRASRRTRTNRDLAIRARIVLGLADGKTGQEVAAHVGVSRQTVSKWRHRFDEFRLAGLEDEPRPGAPRRITDARVEEVVVKTLETLPEGQTHWSTRQLADKLGVSQSSVSRIWRAFGLQPHRTKGFKLSPDPLLIDKVRDIVGLYMSPPANAVVLCVDEKSQIQALERSQPVIPMQIGQEEIRTHDYRRHGTTTLFAALNVATGKVVGKCSPGHTAKEFVRFMNHVNENVPAEVDIHVVIDNYGTHKSAEAKRWFVKHPRYHLHFTPTYSSWINQVERWFALLTQRAIKRGSHRSTRELERAIQSFLDAHNADPKPFVWVKSADEILASIARFATKTAQLREPGICQEFNDSGH